MVSGFINQVPVTSQSVVCSFLFGLWPYATTEVYNYFVYKQFATHSLIVVEL